MGRRMSRADAFLTAGNILCVAAIVIIAAVIGTDQWLKFTVDRTQLGSLRNSSETGDSALYTHTRHRGMFRECYPGTDTKFLDTAKDVIDKNCFFIRLVDNIDGQSEKYRLRWGLHTGFVIMFLLGELVLVIGYIIGLCMCMGKLLRDAWYVAILSFFGAFLLAFGMALFHGSVHVEREQVATSPPGRQLFYQQWPTELQRATTMEYKESYQAAWAGVALVIIACICYVIAAKLLPNPKKSKKVPPRDLQTYGYPQQPVLYASERQPQVYYVA